MADGVLTDTQKEQIKLRATFLNNIGIGVMLIGVFTPIIRVAYGDTSQHVRSLWLVVALFGCFCIGITLHLFANQILKELSR